MDKLYIMSALKHYSKKKPLRFHMPGHKASRQFKEYFGQASKDITELAFSDYPLTFIEVVKRAEERTAEILGSEKSYYLTDGSSSGVFIMLASVMDRGKKIIVCRNSHKSVFNACRILGIEPYVLHQNVKHGVILPPSSEEIEKIIKNNSDVIGALLTTPDYYGNATDLKEARFILQKYKKLLLVDGAHGSHFRFDKEMSYAGDYADIWVDGVHKTLPALTQGAVISVKNTKLIANVEKYFSIFTTSSRNSQILASIEYAELFMEERGAELLKDLKEELLMFKKRLRVKGLKFYDSYDYLKLVVDFKNVGIDSKLAEEYLKKKGIYSEFSDGRYVVMMLSAFTKKSELRRLEVALSRLIKTKKLKNTYKEGQILSFGKKFFSFLLAESSEKELVPLRRAVGKIAGENFGLFPPCTPLVIAGEAITQEVCDLLQKADGVFGIYDGKVYVTR